MLVLSIIILTVTLAQAQPEVEWRRDYGTRVGEDDFTSHLRTENGGWALSGRATINGIRHVYLVATDDEGEVILEEVYGDGGIGRHAYDMLQTEDGGYLMGGNWSANRQGRFGAMRVDAEGNEIWTRTYGNASFEKCEAVLALKNDEYLLTGRSNANGNRNGYLIKIEGNGNVIWERTYGGDNDDGFYDIIEVENGYTLAGYTYSFGAGQTDMWLVRVNEDGEEMWSETYGGELYDYAYALIRTPEDGGYMLSGRSGNRQRPWNAALVKTNNNGNQQWMNLYFHDEISSRLFDLKQMVDGGYIGVGYATGDDLLVGYSLRVDNGGNLMWERFDSEDGHALFSSVVLDDDNGITMAGWVALPWERGTYWQGWFVKLQTADMPPMILSKTPRDSIVRVPRDGNLDFKVVAVDPEGGDLTYSWFFEGDTISNADSVNLHFPELDTLSLQVFVRDRTWTVSTGWQIIVVPVLIEEWSPEDTILTVRQHDIRTFEVVPAIEDEDIIFEWRNNQRIIGDTNSVLIAFSDIGDFTITSTVAAMDVEESVRWYVEVNNPQDVEKINVEPQTFRIYPPHPNPFNSTTTVSFSLPIGMEAILTVFNLTGREVEQIHGGYRPAGRYEISIEAHNWKSGIYIIQLQASKEVGYTKLLYVE